MVLRRLRSDGKEMYQNAWSTCFGARAFARASKQKLKLLFASLYISVVVVGS